MRKMFVCGWILLALATAMIAPPLFAQDGETAVETDQQTTAAAGVEPDTPWYREMTPLGNEVWQIGALFLSLLLGLIVGRIAKAIVNGSAARLERRDSRYATAALRSLARVTTPAACLIGLWIGLEFLGSVMIFSDHPFEMGDSIEAGGHSGSVESVGFRSTRIRTSDGHVICIPNGTLANMSIKNVSSRPFLKRSFDLRLTADTPPEKVRRAIDVVGEILDRHEGMHEDKTPLVHFSELSGSTLNIQIVYWHFPADGAGFRALNERVNVEILRRFNEEGISLK